MAPRPATRRMLEVYKVESLVRASKQHRCTNGERCAGDGTIWPGTYYVNPHNNPNYGVPVIKKCGWCALRGVCDEDLLYRLQKAMGGDEREPEPDQ